MRSAILVALVLLAGCSTTWRHPTKSSADFEGDLYRCEVDAAAQADPIFRRRMLERCLRSQGWSAV